ncbi:MAG: type IV toxin-antitoxin system AbiEi family antitoxin domain-containing protein [Phycisphaerae bacterium]|jgi:predicted transcriptional regulator of viral defense system
MAYRSTQKALRTLTAVAATQGGYFTARQAEQGGYDFSHLTYHVNRGNFERVGRGLYRISTIPPSEHDDLIRLTLWSRGRDDVPQAVVSHESALSLHELSDMLPGKIHLTVPRSFRREAPPECTLHKADLATKDSTAWGSFRVTTPLRTLLDVAIEDTVPTEQVQRALHDALERGLVVRSKLRAAAEAADPYGRLAKLVAEPS